MTFDDLKKIATGKTLFRLDAVLSTRLVPVLYALGLAGILLWAVGHLFSSFGANFGNGLWGILEIIVFGALMIVALRIVCEAVLVYFKAHETASDAVNSTRVSSSLLDDVREAIRDLADREDDDFPLDTSDIEDYLTPATDAAPVVQASPAADVSEPGTIAAVKRTAKRTPRSKDET